MTVHSQSTLHTFTYNGQMQNVQIIHTTFAKVKVRHLDWTDAR